MEPDRLILFREKSAAILSESTVTAATHIYISKQNVFRQALQILSLKVHETRVCAVGNNQVIASVYIDIPPHGDHPVLYKKKIFGDYKLTEEDALESAKLAALHYLQKAGIILVDDINLSELMKRETELEECQKKLLAASSWANLFQERVEALKIELAAMCEENKKLLSAGKLIHAKKEVSSNEDLELKTNVLPIPVAGITIDISTPPINNQPGTRLRGRTHGLVVTPGITCLRFPSDGYRHYAPEPFCCFWMSLPVALVDTACSLPAVV